VQYRTHLPDRDYDLHVNVATDPEMPPVRPSLCSNILCIYYVHILYIMFIYMGCVYTIYTLCVDTRRL
jgi:hypothetical protein